MKRITMCVYVETAEDATRVTKAMAIAAAQNAVCESIASKVEEFDTGMNTEKDRRFNESFGLHA